MGKTQKTSLSFSLVRSLACLWHLLHAALSRCRRFALTSFWAPDPRRGGQKFLCRNRVSQKFFQNISNKKVKESYYGITANTGSIASNIPIWITLYMGWPPIPPPLCVRTRVQLLVRTASPPFPFSRTNCPALVICASEGTFFGPIISDLTFYDFLPPSRCQDLQSSPLYFFRMQVHFSPINGNNKIGWGLWKKE